MSRGKPLKRILATLTLVVFIIIGFYYALYLDIKNRSRHISKLTHELSLQEEAEKYAISTKNKIESISSDIANINNSIIPYGGDIQFIEDFELLANSNDLELEIESLLLEDQPRTLASGVVIFKIRAKTRGSWADTYRFLNQIESLPLKIKVSQFSILGQEVSLGTNKKKTEWQSQFEVYLLKYK
ncbi:MAG: hypothetical protein ABL917_02765 [Parcubacteria group bacterium]